MGWCAWKWSQVRLVRGCPFHFCGERCRAEAALSLHAELPGVLGTIPAPSWRRLARAARLEDATVGFEFAALRLSGLPRPRGRI